jgi:5-carboxymethyl-2-hydroxymuconate isomerase
MALYHTIAAELFGKLEAKMLERVETRMSTVSTEVSEIHSFLAQQQQL